MQSDTFVHIWALLSPQGEFRTREKVCRNVWAQFSLTKQREIYSRIRDKLRRGEPVSPNPYFAILQNEVESIESPRASQPTNYNGARSLPDEPLVRALAPRNVHFPRGQTVLLAYFYRTFALISNR